MKVNAARCMPLSVETPTDPVPARHWEENLYVTDQNMLEFD
jgi:hypothetical protein